MAGSLAMLALRPAGADDVTDAIQDGLNEYKQGRLSSAIEHLELAAGLLRNKKAQYLKTLLPPALPGWQVDEGLSSVMAAGLYGGGISAQRVYRQGEKMVMVRYVTDSVLLQSAMLAFSDPAFASANGGKFITLRGEKAIVKYAKEDKSGEVAIVLHRRILVSVRGTKASQQELEAYAAAVDFKNLARLP